ncbi:hypothetical protein [Streptomyces sp. NPDC054838]
MVTVIEVTLRGGKWVYRDLNFSLPAPENSAEDSTESPGAPGPPRPVAPFASPRNGTASVTVGKDSQRIYYADTYGSIIELAVDGKDVRWRNFTADVGAPIAGVGSPLAATVQGGVTVHYFDAANRLVRLWHKNGNTWTVRTYNKPPKASAASPLAATVTDDVRRVLIYYMNTRNQLLEVSWTHNKEPLVTNLSTWISGPLPMSPVSPLAAVGFASDIRRIYYLDVNNSPIQLAHNVDAPTNQYPTGRKWWSWANLTQAAGAKYALDGDPMVVALTRTSQPRVYYQDWAGNVAALAWSGIGWSYSTPGELANGEAGAPTAAPAGALAAVLSADDVKQFLFYLDRSDHLISLQWTGRLWYSVDLSAELRLPPTAHACPISAVFDGDPYAYYLSSE